MTKKKREQMVLLKDIVIPKGTVFSKSPAITERVSDDHFTAYFGLSKNTAGAIEYCINDDADKMDEWFTSLK